MPAALTFWWLWHPLEGVGYQFWSGVGSDFGQVTLITGLLAVALTWRHHHRCHGDGCRKVGLHRVQGTPHKVCWNHHPVLSQHPRGRVPLHVIHERHHAAGDSRRPL